MIYLIQLYKIVKDKKHFINIFTDFEKKVKEQGFKNHPEIFFECLLSGQFKIRIRNKMQIIMILEAIFKKKDLSFLEAFN